MSAISTPKPSVIAIKMASRLIFKGMHIPKRQQPLSKRHYNASSNATNAPHSTSPGNPANDTTIPTPNTVATIPLWQRLGPLSRGFQAYGRSQRKRPYATQFVSSLVIYFLGDMSAQNINGDEYDYRRTLRALVISMGSSIPSYKWCV